MEKNQSGPPEPYVEGTTGTILEKTQEQRGKPTWAIFGNKLVPERYIIETLEAGVYTIGYDDNVGGHYFEKGVLNTEELMYDGECVIDIMKYLEIFWNSEKFFRKYKLNYKRGVLMYGPPGTGKSCIMRAIIMMMVARNGVVIIGESDNYDSNPTIIHKGIKKMAKTEPDRKILVCIEDIEGYIKREYEAALINMMDGTESIDNVVYLATTNYIDRLPKRLTRPSRFDHIVEIPPPDEETRWKYLKHLASGNGFEIPKEWKKGTNGMTYAEMKETFISVMIFKKTFAEVKKRFKIEYGGKEVV